MGRKRPMNLLEYPHFGADAAVRCGGCGRTATFAPRDLGERFGSFGMVRPVETLALRLKCYACGHRGALIIPVPAKCPNAE